MSTIRTHISLPQDLLRDIDALVGKRARSAFIAEAARSAVERRKQITALKQAAGSWKDHLHPELGDGAAEWVRKLRSADEKQDRKRRGSLSA